MACPSSSSSSSSSQFSTSAAITLLAILAALVPWAAVGGTSAGVGPKEYQLRESSQPHHSSIRSEGLIARKVLSFDKRGEEEKKDQRPVFASGVGIFSTSYDNHSESRRRIEEEGPASQFPWLLFNESLLTLRGNLLPNDPYYQKRYIRSLLLSQDETTIYFAHDKESTDSQIGKAVRLPNPSSFPASTSSSQSETSPLSSLYTVRNIFKDAINLDMGQSLSSRVNCLEILEENRTLLYGYHHTPRIQQVGVEDGREETFIPSAAGFGMVRHPKLRTLFASASTMVLTMPLSPGTRDISTLAGGAVAGNASGNGAEVRFGTEGARINPRSISRDGSVLYVADRTNFLVRRVNTTTRETQALRFANGTVVPMSFGPLSVVTSSDDCNLFVTGWTDYSNPSGQPSVVQWVAFDTPHGYVSWTKDVVLFNHTPFTSPAFPVMEWTGVNEPSRLLLSHNDTDLYLGTSNGEIFQFAINRSALHKCGPYDPANPPGFGPLPLYVRPSPSPGPELDSQLRLTVILGVMIIALLGVTITLVLWWTGRLCFCSKRGLLASGGSADSAAQLPKTDSQWLRGRWCRFFGHPNSVSAGDKGYPNSACGDSKTTSSAMTTSSSLFHGGQLGLSTISRELDHLDAPRPIPFAVLTGATEDFSDTHKVVGVRGGFGDLYRATLRVGGESRATVDVALKVMRGAPDEMKCKQFLSEVITLSRARHAHLCKLLGYCVEQNMVVLVYPFISGGSLHDRLHPHPPPPPHPQPSAQALPSPTPVPPPPPHPPLDWRSRLSVALQIGTALRYLHEELEPPLLHRDIKSSNVLVDGYGEKVKAYLTDFGLAKIGNPSAGMERGRETVQTDYRAGTVGYMAPEYAIELKLTAKNDVYGFGVILLEMVTGKSAFFWNSSGDERKNDDADMYDEALSDSESEGGGHRHPVLLVHWARKRFERVPTWDYLLLSKMVDPLLVQSFDVPGGSNWERETLCAVARLGQVCTDADASKRPRMGVVVERIKAIVHEGEKR